MYFQKALEIYSNLQMQNHLNDGATLNNFGLVCYSRASYSKAEEYYIKALEIVYNLRGKSDPNYSVSISNLAALYDHMGDYSKAEEYYIKALESDPNKPLFS